MKKLFFSSVALSLVVFVQPENKSDFKSEEKTAYEEPHCRLQTEGPLKGQYACAFFPKNNLNIPAGGVTSGHNYEAFHQVINTIEKIYQPIVAQNGGSLKINKLWDDGQVNAYASREDGSTFSVYMFGGLARHPLMTADGFALALCHEIGHHIGGAPRYPKEWASNEGQADYFASLQCMKLVLAQADNIKALERIKVSPEIRSLCANRYQSYANGMKLSAICTRIGMAGQALGAVLASLRGAPVPTTESRDRKMVGKTFDGHPQGQCRFDTYLAGALCTKDPRWKLGDNLQQASCWYGSASEVAGARPLCWFKP